MPVASKLSATQADPRQADPRHDGDLAATVAKDRFIGVEEALAKLAHQAASDSPALQNRGQRPENAAAPPPDATLRSADFRDPLPSEPPRMRAAGGARLLIAVCIGAAVMLAWRSYGGVARETVAAWAPQLGWITARAPTRATPVSSTSSPAAAPAAPPPPVVAAAAPPAAAPAAPAAQPAPATVTPSESATASADRRQIETMTRELAAMRQTVEQLAAGQEQLKGEIAKLRTDKLQADKLQADKPPPEKRVPRRVSTPSASPIAAPAH